VDVVVVRHGKNLKGRFLGVVLGTVGKGVLQRHWIRPSGPSKLGTTRREAGTDDVEILASIAIVADPNIGFATLALLVGLGFMLNSFGTAGVGWSMRDLRQVASSSA
jgi:hypothetical protein